MQLDISAAMEIYPRCLVKRWSQFLLPALQNCGVLVRIVVSGNLSE